MSDTNNLNDLTAAEKAAVTSEEAVKAEAPAAAPEQAPAPAEVPAEAAAAAPAQEAAPAEEAAPAPKKRTRKKAAAEKDEKVEKAAAKKPAAKRTTKKKEDAEAAAEKKPAAKTTRKKKADADAPAAEKKPAAKRTRKKKTEETPVVEEVKEVPVEVIEEVKEAPAEGIEEVKEAPAEVIEEVKEAPAEVIEEVPAEPELPQPRRSIAFIGSECYPFVKTGGLGDVMYALPKALIAQNCDVKVILPRYKCIPQQYQDKMVYRGAFEMNLCADGRSYYVGIMEYVWDGVVYDFIDNEEFFSEGKPYTNLIDDIPKYCYFGKAALAALNYMDWIPDVIHCHDWQAGLVPVYLREFFGNTPIGRSKVMITIHNLRFQGIYDIKTIQYWSGLPDYVFNKDALKQGYNDANMFKGGLTYANMITTVSGTYAGEIQTPFFGENLDAHLRYHSGKLRGIINGIDYGMWDSANDSLLAAPYDIETVIEKKKANKLALQEELGLEKDEGKFVIGLISRLTNQKGLDLINSIVPAVMDGNTQIVVLGTGDDEYENSFRGYEYQYKGSFCANIMYDEGRAHKIYAGSDALLVPSLFEPCGLTQLICMHYGTVPIVRETGGLKDTVEPFNEYTNEGNGFTFDRYDAGLLLDAINRAKTVYFTERERWDQMVQRDMAKDVSWENSAKQYRALYVEMTQ